MRLKNNIFIILSICIVISCTCKDDTRSNTALNALEIDLIDFNGETTLIYENQDGTTFNAIAAYEEKMFQEDRPFAETCDVFLYESQKSSLFFPNQSEIPTMFLTVESPNRSSTSLIIDTRGEDSSGNNLSEYFILLNLDDQNLETSDFSSISRDGFDFTNSVIIPNRDTVTTIEEFVMSLENGIELIRFQDGTYLKLIP